MSDETENNLVPANDRIIPINIEDHMKSAYIDYSMSVIVSRALPDARDGLKPVHRRVLYGMLDLGVTSGKPYKKSARIVGDVLGKYHPHGDLSVYDTMVRMAQDWSLRYPLVDGQGNYGSVDGDPPAAMRYTEARLKKIAEETLIDINKDTVDYQLNFDDSLKEPTVLPTRIPHLLVNGASGIAVGMATNMAPHNLSEVVDGMIAYIQDRDIDIAGLMQYIKAPDFPTGGIIYGYNGVKDAFETGRGRIVMRGKAEIETDRNGRESIIVTEIPYLVNKAQMIERTAELVNEKKIEGISTIRDESDRDGFRIVYEIRRDANANVVLNNLYKYTALQSSFSVNNIALVKGRPELLNLKDMIEVFVDHRHEVVIRRTKYELAEAEKRAHILEGLLIAIDHLDEVIKLIRSSATPEDARIGLMERFGLSEEQAKAILDMTLRRLTGLERDKIKQEFAELQETIAYLKSILADEGLRMQIIIDELLEVKEKYGDERRSQIVYSAEDMTMEDFIDDEEVVITISHNSYVKRTPLTEYRRQGRGGKGAIGTNTRDEDFTEHIITASTHNYMLLFTESGKCYWLRAFEIPEGSRTSRGRALQNIINIPKDDKVKAFILVENLKDQEYLDNNYIIMCTKKGTIKKTSLEAYSRPRANGINAINIAEGDQLLEASLTNGSSEILMGLRSGRAIRFNESKVRPMGRTATGVRGITLGSEADEVIGMISVNDEDTSVLVVSEKGYGKRSSLDDYRVTNRGGKGVKTLNITDKTGSLVAIKGVTDNDDLMIINKSGIVIRIGVETLRVMGRATQGVRLITLKENDEIASIAKVQREDEEDEVIEGEFTDGEDHHIENDSSGEDNSTDENEEE
ncbi:MAG TPA: DNA gyrase subunit A [Candidatus Sphingobacterium stercoripullorum]|uniref:DNA gyrase subunit A n=1 Tax=Candidatus Sphingobacterium stercoripullorum TaxID=2838759 RepID=A0A9D1WAM2_9SPHI|nr:DNA gyrase subunit A [Candidatus Sphingobacterium stercoripullorum]